MLGKLAKLLPASWRKKLFHKPPVVAVIRLHGALMTGGGPMRQNLNLAGIEDLMNDAFELKRLTAVALEINCPGGAPVQAALIHDRLRALAAEKNIKIYAFCEDVAASGGYWIACAGDEIYADANSIVGSIGVISASFGFKEAIARLGIERRMHTSGENKSFLDAFLDENPEDVARLKLLQSEIHGRFKDHVRTRRGDRLKGEEKELFSGEFWTGASALDLGLIDGLGDVRSIMRDRFGDEVKLEVMEEQRGWLQRKLNLRHRGPGAEQLITATFDMIESRLLWQRYR